MAHYVQGDDSLPLGENSVTIFQCFVTLFTDIAVTHVHNAYKEFRNKMKQDNDINAMLAICQR